MNYDHEICNHLIFFLYHLQNYTKCSSEFFLSDTEKSTCIRNWMTVFNHSATHQFSFLIPLNCKCEPSTFQHSQPKLQFCQYEIQVVYDLISSFLFPPLFLPVASLSTCGNIMENWTEIGIWGYRRLGLFLFVVKCTHLWVRLLWTFQCFHCLSFV